MRKLWTVGGLMLAVALIAASARLIQAGGPVISKSGISDPDPGYGRTTIVAANKGPSSQRLSRHYTTSWEATARWQDRGPRPWA